MNHVFRLVTLAIIVAISTAPGASARAQDSGADPNDPIAFPTPDDSDQSGDEFDLAAMTLDSTSIPPEYFFAYEGYISAEQYDDNTVGGVDEDELLDAGFIGFYDSWYFNSNGDNIRSFAGSFETVEGLEDAFVLFEDEEKLRPNSDLQDSDPLDGVGEQPAETTAGTIENGNGTTSDYYDVSFRIDRLYLGVAMETQGDAEIDTSLVDDLAAELADRVQAVQDGDQVSGVVYGLDELMVYPDPGDGLTHDGYQSPDESFVLFSAEEISSNIIGTYETGTRLTVLITTFYPFLTLSISEFESADQVADALEDPEGLIYPYQDMEAIDTIDVDQADTFAAFVFTSSDGEEQNSIRIFAQVENYLIIVDVHGHESIDDATGVATDYANALVSCVAGGSCDAP